MKECLFCRRSIRIEPSLPNILDALTSETMVRNLGRERECEGRMPFDEDAA